ncbi:MAG TPA: pirin [Clostridiales bacterium UBA8960]|jgi:redox-sensitive bicupin YhaK (pirin superfamily)|nr:pirin [Clostridiales bacterium UBA8960]
MSHRILRLQKIDFHWEMENPFIFCAHHKDAYPKGDENQEPTVSLTGRQLGEDFAIKDGFRMYHGTKVPGFPMHPHRGFETVTIVKTGFVDHFDSVGASGRYGNGDVQWLTTGSGCQHAEMFPLVSMEEENPLELFQVWLNLPAKDKFTKPAYKMLWSEDIPNITIGDDYGPKAMITIISGGFEGKHGLTPNPASYASDPNHHLNILLIEMEPYSEINLPQVSKTLVRNLYYYEGEGHITIGTEKIPSSRRIKLDGNEVIEITNGSKTSYLLLLEGEPINEPVVSYGPFVMNTEQEIRNAFSDYQHTRFGGWPWNRTDPINPRDSGRYAKYMDGTYEKK